MTVDGHGAERGVRRGARETEYGAAETGSESIEVTGPRRLSFELSELLSTVTLPRLKRCRDQLMC